VDSVVTDPPYGLKFMGKKWDYNVPTVEVWTECLRVLKPGGHMLAFAGTRTQHRMAVRIEDAGFEIRDMIAWVYGSGFPKSLDVSKAIDKATGAEREVVGQRRGAVNPKGYKTDGNSQSGGAFADGEFDITAPATPEAQQWAGWGTALKPALEPITMARKPLAGTVAANVLEHGTGALNVDGCRVGEDTIKTYGVRKGTGNALGWSKYISPEDYVGVAHNGRWPANLIHDGTDEVVGLFPSGSTGSAARFFYCPKASKRERGEGNIHPTVKPVELMRYLCRLVTPPGGVVLDPFMGSGSTGMACELEGFDFIGIERESEYLEIATQRIRRAQSQ
jgi:site-specific DNA-methyltransferase (adenine-specific)